MQIRYLTVSYLLRRQGDCVTPAVPFIRISGRWLRAAGFEIEDRIEVDVGHGCLTIKKLTADGEPLKPKKGQIEIDFSAGANDSTK